MVDVGHSLTFNKSVLPTVQYRLNFLVKRQMTPLLKQVSVILLTGTVLVGLLRTGTGAAT